MGAAPDIRSQGKYPPFGGPNVMSMGENTKIPVMTDKIMHRISTLPTRTKS